MEEKILKVTTNGEYKNINLREKLVVEVGGETVVTEKFVLEDGFITVTKQFAEGLEKVGKYGKYFICKMIYNGEEVSTIMNERMHEAYKVLGGEDSTIKVIGKRNDKWLNFSFELVE